jgi:hypothetical protein
MTWVVWRQHRAQVLVLGVILLAFAVLLGITGTRLADEYRAAQQCADCSGAGLMQSYELPRILVNLTVAVPLVLGVFLGTTIMGREVEQSTHVLAWTQSVSRRRWLTVKLVGVFAGAAAIAGVMSTLVTWWSGTLNSLEDFRFEALQFDTQNLAPVAYTIFAVALGFVAGAVLRRMLPAVGVTVVGYVAVRLFVELSLRPHYRKAVHVSRSLFAAAHRATGDWVFGSELVDKAGKVIHGPLRMPTSCASAVDRAAADRCMSKLGYRIVSTVHPADRYWPFQWTEAAIFVGLAAVLVAVGAWFVLRRDA